MKEIDWQTQPRASSYVRLPCEFLRAMTVTEVERSESEGAVSQGSLGRS